MKFYCDRCNAKYSIADEKVRGKVVKVRCKRCDEIIEVSDDMRRAREAAVEARQGEEAERTSATHPDVAEPQWYYSVEGETLGPLPETELLEKYEDGQIGEDSFVWRDGFDGWKSADDVEPFATAIEQEDDSLDPNRTMGVGESIEAVESPDSDGGSRRTGPPGSDANEARDGSPGDDAREERLDRLRNKLKSDFGAGTSGRDRADSGLVPSPGSGEGAEEDREDVSLEESAADVPSAGLGDEEADEEDEGPSGLGASDALESQGETEEPTGDLAESNLPEGDDAALGPAGEEGLGPESGDGAPSGPLGDGESGDDSAIPEFGGETPGESEEASEPGSGIESVGDQDVDSSLDLDAGDDGELAPKPEDVGDEEASGEEAAPEEDDFSLPPSGSDRLGADESDEPDDEDEEEGNEGLFEGVDEASDDEASEDEETAIPTAPDLSSEADATSGGYGEGITESLMIQLDQIQEEGKKERWTKIGAAVVLIGIAGFGLYNVWQTEGGSPLPSAMRSSESEYYIPEDGPAVQKRYSDEERDDIFSVEPQVVERGKGEEDETEGTDPRAEGSSEAPEAEKPSGPTESGREEGDPDDQEEPERLAEAEEAGSQEEDETVSPLDPGSAIPDSDGPSMDEAFESAEARSSEDEESNSLGDSEAEEAVTAESESIDDEEESSEGGLDPGMQALTEGPSGTQPAIEHREDPSASDNEDEAGGLPQKLSKEQIQAGIETVRESVGTCRRRQDRRGAPLDVRKIYLTLEVAPSGDVDSYSIEPKKVDNTAFEHCMTSHQGRWKFGSFEGGSEKVRAPFILQ